MLGLVQKHDQGGGRQHPQGDGGGRPAPGGAQDQGQAQGAGGHQQRPGAVAQAQGDVASCRQGGVAGHDLQVGVEGRLRVVEDGELGPRSRSPRRARSEGRLPAGRRYEPVHVQHRLGTETGVHRDRHPDRPDGQEPAHLVGGERVGLL